jgi:hypothetical protein|tara:strand:- start:51 stop:542 length:492 start_codon:yes stop_codon:yes gene_type:complete
MKINEIVEPSGSRPHRTDRPDPKVMNDFLQKSAAVGSPSAKDPNVIAKARSMYAAGGLSADEAFSIAKGIVRADNKSVGDVDKVAGTQKFNPMAKQAPKGIAKGWDDTTHGHLRKDKAMKSIGPDAETSYSRAKTGKGNFKSGANLGGKIGQKIAGIMNTRMK